MRTTCKAFGRRARPFASILIWGNLRECRGGFCRPFRLSETLGRTGAPAAGGFDHRQRPARWRRIALRRKATFSDAAGRTADAGGSRKLRKESRGVLFGKLKGRLLPPLVEGRS